MIENLKGKIEKVDEVILEFMNSPSCGEDETTHEIQVEKNGKK